MSTFSTSLKELWFGVLQGVVKTGLAIAIPEAQKAWANLNECPTDEHAKGLWNWTRWFAMICPYLPRSGTFIYYIVYTTTP